MNKSCFSLVLMFVPLSVVSMQQKSLYMLEQMICSAVENGREADVRKIIEGEEAVVSLINKQDANGDTLLHRAAGGGYAGIMDLLLKAGAKVDSINKENLTPLNTAARLSKKDVVTALIATGASPVPDKYGRNPLHYAALSDRPAIAKEILRAYPKTLSAADNNGQTPLHLAADKNRYRVARVLLASGANRLACDAYGRIPLHCAAQRLDLEMMKLLASSDPTSFDFPDKNGRTPFDLASAAIEKQTTRIEELKKNLAELRVPKDESGSKK